MKIKICYAILLVFIVTGAFCGCGTTTNGTKSSFEELDVHYITNDNGTYTYEGNIYEHKIEVSGIEGDSQVTFIVLTNDTETIVNDLNKLILIFWVTYVILSSGGIAYEHSQVQYKSRNFIGTGEGHYVVDR